MQMHVRKLGREVLYSLVCCVLSAESLNCVSTAGTAVGLQEDGVSQVCPPSPPQLDPFYTQGLENIGLYATLCIAVWCTLNILQT